MKVTAWTAGEGSRRKAMVPFACAESGMPLGTWADVSSWKFTARASDHEQGISDFWAGFGAPGPAPSVLCGGSGNSCRGILAEPRAPVSARFRRGDTASWISP